MVGLHVVTHLKKNGVFIEMFKFNTPLGVVQVTMETFDLGVSLYGNKHGTPRGVKLKHLWKHP